MSHREIALTHGQYALVDESDYELVSAYRWHAKPSYSRNGRLLTYYAVTTLRDGQLRMHRLIAGAPSGLHVDHRNGNGLDNRRENLRIATPTQNAANRRTDGIKASRYRGVSRKYGKWRAQVGWKGGNVGCFNTEEEAARAYDLVALERFGEFAVLNFPEEHNPTDVGQG